MLFVFSPLPSAQADRVQLISETSSAARVQFEGEILDYTGRAIRLRLPGGLEKSFAGERVISIDAEWLAEHRRADDAWSEGDVASAAQLYTQALSADERVWVRRLLLSRIVYCQAAQGQIEQAAQRFLALVASDPDTPYFAAIPLAWDATEMVSKSTATDWLAKSEQPAAVLLGASHLLATDRRPAAAAALEKLRTVDDVRIAALAEAQLWRVSAFRATEVQLDGWQARAEQMPAEVLAGPYLLLGQSLLRQKRFDEAALALMQVRILYPDARPLAAVALLSAGDALLGLGQPVQAIGLFREAEVTYPNTIWQTQAAERLNKLQPSRTNEGKR